MNCCFRSLLLVAGLALAAAPVLAQDALQQLEQQLRQPPVQGEPAQPTSGWLGAVADDEQPLAGVRLMQIAPESPAARAGLEAGDMVIGLNGNKVRGLEDFAQVLKNAPAGAELTFEVHRDGRTRMVEVTLGARPPADALPRPAGALRVQQELLGVRTAPLSDAERRRIEVPVGRGAHVTSVTVGSPAELAGIPVDSVIVGVNNRIVASPTQLDQRLAALGPGEVAEIAYYRGQRLVRQQLRLSPGRLAPEQQIRQLQGQVDELEQRVLELEERFQALEQQSPRD